MKKLSILILFFTIISYSLQAQQNEIKTDFYNAIKSEVDPFIKESFFVQMDPASDIYEYAKSLIISAFAESGNVEKVNYWLNTINGEEAKNTAIYSAIHSYISAKRLNEAETLILPFIRTGEEKVYNSTHGNVLNFKSLYVLLLYGQGNYPEALKCMTPHFQKNLHDLYAIALVKAGDPKVAIQEIKLELQKPGDKKEDVKSAAREIFEKIYGNDQYYNKFIDSVAEVNGRILIEKINKKMISTPSPDFSITSVKGKGVSLQSLKGKTIIIDFWATWCQPCVGSFPAMQKLVNYFSKDTSVVFIFIHTSERNSDATEVAEKLLLMKHYTFDLYMDLKDPVRKENPLGETFEIEYLPTKIIIDKNGNIRFRETGYIDEYEGYEETKTMIEMIMK
ncbi:MAG: TlpA disulfide reductase family protein [Rikenellaceae bacterium]|nr:TlpA disulfide reductase family protein [Rikenellaceae bacterium]